MNKAYLFLLFLLIGAGVSPANTQYIPGKLSEDATISIITVGPAEPTYTAFGHTAIRLQDPRHQIDQVYNYGTFDFDSPGFFFKFLYGDLNYHLSVVPFAQFRQANVDLGRSLVSQTLNLSQSQINALVEQLEQNMLPENRSYRYQFFSQNCVTQVRDLLSRQSAISPFRQTKAVVLSGSTYRQKLSTYLTNRPWMELGVNLMLGAGADEPLTKHEQNFLPNTLHLSLANGSDASGDRIVESSTTIAPAVMQERAFSPPPFLVLWPGFLIVIALTATSLRLGWQGWWLDRILFGGVGLLGVIIAFGSFVSLHQPLHHNWNLLWALPTHLLVAVWVKRMSQIKYLHVYFWVTLALNMGILAAWQAIPQGLPLAIIPIIGSLIVRSAFRIYMNSQHSALNRNAKISNHISSQKMNLQPVKNNRYE